MNSHILKSLLASALLAFAVTAASAQELKIGYVNSDRVLRDAVPAKAAQAKLEAEFSKREKDLNELANRLKTASDRLDKDAPTLGEAERTRRSASSSTRTASCSAPARVPGGPEPAQERGAGDRRRADQPRHQADLRDREVRPDPAGSRVLEPEGRHHRQGDQGAQRPRRQQDRAGWAKSSFATSSSGSAAN